MASKIQGIALILLGFCLFFYVNALKRGAAFRITL